MSNVNMTVNVDGGGETAPPVVPMTYQVRVVFDARADGDVSGPFTQATAEAFAIAAIARTGVQRVAIEQYTG